MTNERIVNIVAHVICRDIIGHGCENCPLYKVGARVDVDDAPYCCRWTRLNIPINVIHKAESLLDREQYIQYRELCLEQGYDPDSCKEIDFV